MATIYSFAQTYYIIRAYLRVHQFEIFLNTFTMNDSLQRTTFILQGFTSACRKYFFPQCLAIKGSLKHPLMIRTLLKHGTIEYTLSQHNVAASFPIKMLTYLVPSCQSNIYDLYKTLRCINIALHSLKVQVTRKRHSLQQLKIPYQQLLPERIVSRAIFPESIVETLTSTCHYSL